MKPISTFTQGIFEIYGTVISNSEDGVQFYHPDDRSKVLQAFNNTITPGEAYDIEVRFINAQGEHLWVRTMGKPVLENGNVVKIIGTLIDITERKLMEEVLLKNEAQCRQIEKAESLGRMAGAIAHKFNNMLNVVIGNIDLAMEEVDGGSDLSDFLTEAGNAAHNASEVSQMMLTYLGQSFDQNEPLDLSEFYRQNLHNLKEAMPKEIDLIANLPSHGPVIDGNSFQVQQILINLVNNAKEAIGGKKGVIHLNVKTVFSGDIPSRHRFPLDWQPMDNSYACLEVSDSGCGITSENIEKLFDPFFTTQFVGRGMGLPVVIGIVRIHSGGITVESEVQKGSVFRVFFPLIEEDATLPEKSHS